MMGEAGASTINTTNGTLRRGIDAGVELLLRPERFFETLLRERGDSLPLLAIWISGMAGVVDGLDTRIVTGMLKPDSPYLTNWSMTWSMIAAAGVVGGCLHWLLGGLWYRIRLRFSGARGVPKRHARNVYVHAELVWTIPSLAWVGLATLFYPTYHAAYMEGPLIMSLVLMIPWSTWVSYRGVRHCFDVRPGPARFWFLILPLALWGLIFAGTMALAALGPF